MKNPAQNLRSQTKSSGSAPSGGVRSQLGGLGRGFAGQIAREPFEIAKTAGGQLGAPYEKTGQARPPQEGEPGPSGATPSTQKQQKQKPKPSAEEKRKESLLKAFRQELEEIHRLQKKREEEMRQRWHEAEEVKKQREEEAKKAEKPLFEPATKVKRGILGGAGRMFGLGKKQRQVEIGKTPTN